MNNNTLTLGLIVSLLLNVFCITASISAHTQRIRNTQLMLEVLTNHTDAIRSNTKSAEENYKTVTKIINILLNEADPEKEIY